MGKGMSVTDRVSIWIAWHLPRLVAEWAFRRVSETGATTNPFDQPVHEPLERWRRASAGWPDDEPDALGGSRHGVES